MSKLMQTGVNSRNYLIMTIILCWSGLVVMSSLYVTVPLIPVFAEQFGITPTQASAAGSIFSLGFAVGCLMYGAISDKYGRKKVILIGMITLTFISFVLGLVHSFAWIIVLRGIQGSAAATFSPVALAYAVEMYPGNRRVTAIGFISTGFLVAGIVGQIISSLINQQYGWNALFVMLAVVYLMTSLVVWAFLPRDEIKRGKDSSIWESLLQIGTVLKQPQLRLSYVVALVLLMSFVSMYSALGSYLSGPAFGLNAQQILYVRAAGILGMLVSPFAGKLTQRLGVRSVLRLGLTMAVVGLACMGFFTNLPLLILMSLLFVTGIALSVPSLVALVGELGGKLRGIAVSVYTFILFAGTSIAPILSIQFMRSGSYLLTFLMIALVLAIGLAAAFLIGKATTEVTQDRVTT
ncbi:MFS transporter [Paenibacillus taichungensis]|uniref:MFS transporter n=1 Tax=Paenibacillus taichungensis TaxID=484184 RepID=UPI00382F8EA5